MATFFVSEESFFAMTAEILLVDDNAIQAATRKAILARTGRTVAVACDGHQALQMLQNPVRMVVTDHLMPGMNGPEFVTQLRVRFPQLPVVVLSGLAEAEDQYENLDVIFRLKPLPPDELISLVRSLLEPIARSA